MRIDRVRLDRYGPLSGVEHDLDDGITVVHGPNESGKTLLIEGMLRLLAPNVVDHVPSIGRVEQAPVGDLRIQHAGEMATIGPEKSLEDLVDVEPADLRNVYVVRDSDLQLENPHAFYATVTERIGDLHTTGIEAIKEEVRSRGRLTPSNRRLSDAAGNDHAATVRDHADELRNELRSYVRRADADDLDALEREGIARRTARRRCREALERQRQAAEAAQVERLRERLATVESARSSPTTADRETLDELRDLVDRRDRLTDRLEEIDRTIEDRREELANTRERRRDRSADLAAAEERAEAVETLRASLDELRTDDPGGPNGRPIGGFLGVVLGTIAVIAGQLVLGGLLLGVGAVAIGVWGYRSYRHRRARRRETAILREARDAGFAVETIGEVAPAIHDYERTRSRLAEERDELRMDEDVLERTVAERREDRREARSTLADVRDELDDRLTELSVDDVDAYADRVERAEERRTERAAAERSLRDGLGDPVEDDPVPAWRRAIEERADALPDDVDPADFDADERERLETRETELTARIEEIDAELSDHRNRIEAFDRRLVELADRDLVSESLELRARTIEGIRDAADRLDGIVDRLERRADVARELLDVFDAIEAEERHKISDLFGPESEATRIFSTLTDGRYETVAYDPGDGTLRVSLPNGENRRPEALSHATRDQLYFAARVGLARRLLGASTGFFLLDDAFLPADPERLAAGFDTLEALAEAGWQILYFTAKPEVGVDVVERRDLATLQLEERL